MASIFQAAVRYPVYNQHYTNTEQWVVKTRP